MINCFECGGECCKKLAFQVEKPRTKEDFEDIKWYLYHEGILVYIDNCGDWMVQMPVKCTKLDTNGKCTIYKDRPPICRNSAVKDCEMNTNEMDIVFKTVEDLEKYMNKNNKNTTKKR